MRRSLVYCCIPIVIYLGDLGVFFIFLKSMALKPTRETPLRLAYLATLPPLPQNKVCGLDPLTRSLGRRLRSKTSQGMVLV